MQCIHTGVPNAFRIKQIVKGKRRKKKPMILQCATERKKKKWMKKVAYAFDNHMLGNRTRSIRSISVGNLTDKTVTHSTYNLMAMVEKVKDERERAASLGTTVVGGGGGAGVPASANEGVTYSMKSPRHREDSDVSEVERLRMALLEAQEELAWQKHRNFQLEKKVAKYIEEVHTLRKEKKQMLEDMKKSGKNIDAFKRTNHHPNHAVSNPNLKEKSTAIFKNRPPPQPPTTLTSTGGDKKDKEEGRKNKGGDQKPTKRKTTATNAGDATGDSWVVETVPHNESHASPKNNSSLNANNNANLSCVV